jgi:hypothetical protein
VSALAPFIGGRIVAIATLADDGVERVTLSVELDARTVRSLAVRSTCWHERVEVLVDGAVVESEAL